MNDPQTIELLTACPFCPSSTIFIEPDEIGSGGQWVAPIHVGCATCKAEQRGDTRGEAIAAWNRRAAPASKPADRDAVLLDLAMLVRQMAHSLSNLPGGSVIANRAVNYLKRKGLEGSPLRSATPAAPEVPAPAASDALNATQCSHGVPYQYPCNVCDAPITKDGVLIEQLLSSRVSTACDFCDGAGGWGSGEDADGCTKCSGTGQVAPQGAQAQPEPEPEMSEACGCRACNPAMVGRWFFVCATCGNKRCPHANDHRNGCTNSNEAGQKGSAYA